MSRSKVALIVLASLALAVPAMTFSALAAPADPVAVINGEAVTRAEFLETLERVAGAQVLDRLLGLRLLLQANRKEHLVAAEEVDREFAGVKGQFATDEEFQTALKANGLTTDGLREQISAKLILDKLGVKGIVVSDEEIANYFKQHEADLSEPEQVRARHILVPTEEEAKKLVEELKAGVDFAKLAADFSKDPGSAGSGGELGFFRKGDLVHEFEQVAFALKPGEVSAPVKTDFGWHIIQVEEHKPAVPATLEGKREAIRSELVKQKTKTPQQVLEGLRQTADVTVFWAP